jgi:MFS transporter, DHA2 family, multidrug resistance protein
MNTEASIKVNPWLIAAAVVLPTFMEVLDTTIVSVALPYIAGNLSASSSEATWVQTSYLVSNAVVLPASAWFSSYFGRKRFFMACIGIFSAASFLCGIAPTLGVLILARVLQGAGGGALQPLSQSILMEAFPPAKRGQAMAVWGFGVIVAPVIGPLLGGWVTDHYSWRWLFYINIPVSLIALWMIRQFIADPAYLRNAKPGRIDAIGFGLLTLWLATMQTVLDKGQEDDWLSATWIRWFSCISVLSLIALVIWELRVQSPIVNLRVLKNRNFALGTVLVTVFGVMIYSPLALLPLFLQNLLGYNALQSGLAQYPRGAGSLMVLPLVGFLSSRVDNRKLIFAGLVLCGVSVLMLGDINLQVAKSNFALANLIQGAGMAMTFVPLATTAMGLLRNTEMGSAAGLFNLMRNLGGSIGTSMVTTMVARDAQAHQVMLVAHVTPFDPNYQAGLQSVQAALAPGVGPTQASVMAPGAIYNSLLQQSNLLAYVDNFRWLALLAFAAILAALCMKRVSTKGSVAIH